MYFISKQLFPTAHIIFQHSHLGKCHHQHLLQQVIPCLIAKDELTEEIAHKCFYVQIVSR